MTDSRFKKVLLSPEDAETHKKWQRAVCAIYAGIILVLATTWGAHYMATDNHAQTADSQAPVMEAHQSEANASY
jgi:hypothetical protein